MNNFFKVSLIFLATLTLQVDVNGQDQISKKLRGAISRADVAFDNFKFNTALKSYQSVLKKDTGNAEVKIKIAETYRSLNAPELAASYFQKAIGTSAFEPKHNLHYAQALMSSGMYEEAKVYYGIYQQTTAGYEIAADRILGIDNLESFFKDSAQYKVKIAEINSPGADFSPSFYDDGIVFVSARHKNEKLAEKFNWDENTFLDLYFSQLSDGQLAAPKKFGNRINTKFHEGPVVFLDAGKRMVFTRNNFYEGKVTTSSKEKINKLQLFTAELSASGNDWINILPLPFNSKEYSIGHPSFNKEETTMYFSSDMPGGFGETDIYKVSYKDGEWGQPLSLGPEVNTEGNEMFPFIHSDGNNSILFFASDGHAGLGGLDLHKSQVINGSVGTPKNLGYPVNTNKDDFGLALNEGGISGYFSSNRNGGVGNDDLYQLDLLSVYFNSLIVDAITGQPIEGAEVRFFEVDNLLAKSSTNDLGQANFDGIVGKKYKVEVLKNGYLPATADFVFEDMAPGDFKEVKIEMNEVPATPILNADVVSIRNHSTNQTFILTDNKAYEILQEGNKIYLIDGDEKKLLADNVSGDIHSNMDLLQSIFGDEYVLNVGKNYKIDNIYYDFDKDFIRVDAADELNDIAEILGKYKFINLVMTAHTDARGSREYNMKLSKERASNAFSYLLQKSVDSSRLNFESVGKSELINDCGSNCSEEEHQLNRRTEFEIRY